MWGFFFFFLHGAMGWGVGKGDEGGMGDGGGVIDA